MKYLTVHTLKLQLIEMEEKGLGSFELFVPSEMGCSGAYITEGYEADIKRTTVTLNSDDME